MEKLFELGALLDAYGAFLTDRQQSMLAQAVEEDCSLAEIAEREGISRQGVRDALKRGEQQLYQMEAVLGLVRRTGELRAELNALLAEIAGMGLGELQRQALELRVQRMLGIVEE